MPSKTPSIFNFFLLFAGIISVTSVQAVETPITNLTECQTAYFKAVSVPEAQRSSVAVQNTMKAWCISQCVNQKISAYATEQKKPVTSALAAELTPAYQPGCTAQIGAPTTSTVASGTSPTGTSATLLPECAWKATPNVTPTPDQDYQCQAATQRKAADDQRKAAAAAEQARLQQQQQDAASAQRRSQNTMMGAAALPMVGQLASGLANGMSGGGTGAAQPAGTATGNNLSYATSGFGNGPGAAPPQPAPVPTTEQGANQQIAESAQDMRSMGERLPPALEEQGREAEANITRDANDENPTPPTQITQNANAGSRTTAENANRVMSRLRPVLCQNIPPSPKIKVPEGQELTINFAKTLAAFEEFLGSGPKNPESSACTGSDSTRRQPEEASSTSPPSGGSGNTSRKPACTDPQNVSAVQRLNSRRDCQCARATESAERLCVESEGMKGMRMVMDAAGPLLLGMNAAAKTCGGMNDVSKFVGAGLTVANAICIREKMKCETTCGNVIGDFAKSYGSFQKKVDSNYGADRQVAVQHCESWEEIANNPANANDTELVSKANTNVKLCHKIFGQIESIYPTAKTIAGEINTGEQNVTSPGTVPQMSALCKAKQRNIVGLATNIGAIALAASNAAKCKKELENKGGGEGGTDPQVAAAEYCSADATKDTQFCKCQGSPSTEGCGAVLAAGVPGTTPNDVRGVNLQSGRGPAAFAGAGGGSDGSGSGGYRGYGLGSDGTASTQANLGTIGSSISGPGNAGGATAGLGGGNASSSAAPSEVKAAKKEEEKSKWSFGSFASSLGNSLGFGGFKGGSGGGGDTSAGLQGNQKAAIERKLASDRYAAEVSPSTGADNFSKIKRSYVQKADTFMGP